MMNDSQGEGDLLLQNTSKKSRACCLTQKKIPKGSKLSAIIAVIGWLLPIPYAITLICSYKYIEAPYFKYQQVNNTASNAYFPFSELLLTVVFILLRFVEYFTFYTYLFIKTTVTEDSNNNPTQDLTPQDVTTQVVTIQVVTTQVVTTQVGEKINKKRTKKIKSIIITNKVFLPLSVLAALAILVIGLTKDLFTAGLVHNNNCGIQNSTLNLISLIVIKRGLQSASYAVSIAIRCLFSCLAISVIKIWFENANPSEPTPTRAQDSETYQAACKEVVKQRNTFNTEYTQKGKRVLKSPMFRSFTPWFVIQFFICFLALFEDVVHALRPWIHGTELTLQKCEWLDVVEVCLYVLFDVIRFAWPYVIGILILKAHYKYFEILQEKYEQAVTSERVGSDLRKAIAGTMPLNKNLDYDFSPQFLLFNIPLNSSGYFLTVIIAFIALIANFLVPTLSQVR